jgi:glycosyltransferase involved in cell wall biosynthesis
MILPKKWLFILPWEISHPGGVNQVVINLLSAIGAQGDFATQLLIDQSARIESNSFNCTQIALSNPFWSSTYLGLIKYCFKIPFILFRLKKIITNDVVCINPHYPSLNVINYVLLKSLGLYEGKIVLSFHGMDVKSINKTQGHERGLWRYIFRKVDALVFCSKALAEEFSNMYNEHSILKKVCVIHNGIDPEYLDRELISAKPLPEILSREKFILNVATFEYKKGQDILIKAFSKIKDKFNIKLCLIGRSSSLVIEYKSLAENLGCADDVYFIEDMLHGDVLSYFQAAEVFCLPSRYEPFGLVLLEAGLFECPIIAAKVGGVAEIITDKDGCLFPPEDEMSLVSALEKILTYAEEANQKAAKFREKVINDFTWCAAANKYINILNSELNQSQPV